MFTDSVRLPGGQLQLLAGVHRHSRRAPRIYCLLLLFSGCTAVTQPESRDSAARQSAFTDSRTEPASETIVAAPRAVSLPQTLRAAGTDPEQVTAGGRFWSPPLDAAPRRLWFAGAAEQRDVQPASLFAAENQWLTPPGGAAPSDQALLAGEISAPANFINGSFFAPPPAGANVLAEADLSQPQYLEPLAAANDLSVEPLTGLPRVWHSIVEDHRQYYSRDNLLWLGAGFGTGAVLANTNLDQQLRNLYQDNVRDVGTDEFYEALHLPKYLGEGTYMLPLYGITMLAGTFADDNSAVGITGDWGERSLRAILVGGPPMLLLQEVTGGSRPDETSHNSDWAFWHDNNGVSGHSFMGAIPFITAAQMTENRLFKGTFYAVSTLTGLSRVNDDAHYPSQVLLGWWMAYLAVSSVSQTELDDQAYRIVPLPIANGAGIGIEFRR